MWHGISFILIMRKGYLTNLFGKKKTLLKFRLNGPIIELEHSVETARFLPQKVSPSASFMQELTEKPLKSWEGA